MPEETYDFDPWSTSTGLPDKITVKLTDPIFTYNTEIADTTCFFKAGGRIVEAEDGAGVGDEFDQHYSCGDGWEPAEKGKKVRREDGKPKRFNNNSNYGRLFASLLNAATEDGVDDALRKRGTPFESATWDGLELYMERVELPKFVGRDGNVVERSVLLVKKIVGGLEGTTPTTKSTTEETTDKASVSGDEASDNGLDPKLKAKLRALARECSSHNEFVERGLDVEGVLDDPKAEQAVMDSGEGSLWASVQS